ncbi:hypothetical protein M407DRAFT_25852 [Tulasnella calospora MUT 4182]|uniref:Mucoidy inhibitor A n=1 Tax=Tulasnella calospora MUT 4182 TaxID=1051891 RepID=A0A0C3QGT8_9AGAM|nr:hypothetical protein M407DRAFT_25852 [Tulasnella calospora MUT 4182]
MSNIIPVDSTELPVHSVCVFQVDRAEVQRIFPVQLKAGQNEVNIERLPNTIDRDSIRVEGLGNAAIFDVIYTPPPTEKAQTKKSLSLNEDLRALEKKIDSLKSEKAILNDQERVLADYAKTLNAEQTDVATLGNFLGVYKERRKQIHLGLQALHEQLTDTEKAAEEKRKALKEDDASKKRAVKITVIVNAEEDGKAELSLWYVVYGASWTPMYDLRATISTSSKEASSIALQYRASISQSTGEDWDEVDLTLSTASPQLGTDIPSLGPYRIGPPYVPQPKSFGSMKKMKRSSMIQAALPTAQYDFPMPGSTALPEMTYATAEAVEGATSTTFVIAGRSTIPSDGDQGGQTHKVSIAFIDLQASLEWITIPKLQQTAFLRCKVKNTSQYVFLPGPSSVFMDNNFVCKSSMPAVSPQESFSTSLGVDPSIKITYHPLQKKTKTSAGNLLSSKTDITSFTQRITVKNTRSTAASPVFIKDQIPVSEDNDFKVILTEPREMGPAKERREVSVLPGAVKARWAFHGDNAEEQSVGSKVLGSFGKGGVEEEGAIEFVCDLGVGKTIDVTVAYEVSGPAGQQWVKL